ncbi:MAG: DUF2064 domain-containing protein [Azospirillum sp.]|nr:DUF2064 domain-containing protein [Azospirillum sp.]
MRRRDTVIVFAKVPRLGTVKTRLAAALGAVPARRVYLALTRRTLAETGRGGPWRTVLALTPPRLCWRGWPRQLPTLDQGGRDLGRRMARCLQRLARPRAVLVGTDIPELSAAAVARAFEALGAADFVFGPAEDGGYWLIGWHRRRAWPLGTLENIRWSSRHALSDSLASLPRGRRIALIDRLGDVDEPTDLAAWKSREALRQSQPAKRRDGP